MYIYIYIHLVQKVKVLNYPFPKVSQGSAHCLNGGGPLLPHFSPHDQRRSSGEWTPPLRHRVTMENIR